MWDFKIDEYRKKAILEDFLVDILYGKYGTKLIMHGGTCIWRCYKGNRFSRDIDLYYDLGAEKFRDFSRALLDYLKEKGLAIKESGYFDTINTFSVITQGDTKVKLDINFSSAPGSAEADYETTGGNKKLIIALPPEMLMNEKIDAYTDKLKKHKDEIQDLYDIWILRQSVTGASAKTLRRVGVLLDTIKDNKPGNSRSLEALMLGGITPSFEKMIKDLKEWEDAGNK